MNGIELLAEIAARLQYLDTPASPRNPSKPGTPSKRKDIESPLPSPPSSPPKVGMRQPVNKVVPVSMPPCRRRTTAAQVHRMLYIFKTLTTFPDAQLRDRLGAEIGMNNREVQVWFQNQRAKVRKLNNRQCAVQSPFGDDDEVVAECDYNYSLPLLSDVIDRMHDSPVLSGQQ